ncbi:helix-turn-helix domain-containing protein [Bacillus smithii]|uniref:HTH cro/C1-type domain-containing protein n=1 Tax=Bacillus smithii 7_3_47FAA TaxID=665952 RepID=G9QIQ4_9BACI|nr:helix-turn-helix transcriptional regulator [Bacillus smithii]EHL78972.1 hypothetical protein HMPREF1015_02981 [Bacillus smithii 7_3_47FAA]
MNIKLRDEYHLLRRKKGIKLKDLAKYVGCSIALLSKYESGKSGMKKEKVELYREFIDNN